MGRNVPFFPDPQQNFQTNKDEHCIKSVKIYVGVDRVNGSNTGPSHRRHKPKP